MGVENGGVRNPNVISVDSGTIDGTKEISGSPDTSSSRSPGFGTWVQVSGNRPALVIIEVTAETDGSSDGYITVDVDDSGGTTSDYNLYVAWSQRQIGTSASVYTTTTLKLSTGAQYRINNAQDPANGNSILNVREIEQ